jgi:hypothetical protein
MTDIPTRPPRWAQALLRCVSRPADRESIPGDLLEEYREVRRPALGRIRADAWYVKHVLSVFWRVMWPCALPMLTAKPLLLMVVPKGWDPSLVPLPNVSLLDAFALLWAGYYGAQRTRLVRTGVVTAGATSVLGFVMTAAFLTLTVPGLLPGLFEQPLLLLFPCIYLSVAVGFGVVVGAGGAVLGRWSPLTTWRAHFS